MDPLLAGLLIGNIVLTALLLVVTLSRRARTAGPGVDLRQDLRDQRSELTDLLRHDREERQTAHRELREDLDSRLDKVRESVDEKLRVTLTVSLKENADRVEALTKANAEKHVELQAVLRDELEKLRLGNEAKLEKMRETVDEKLQGTLEKRLGESFTLVSTRLEEVQKGLGEMQTLASDVGGLKRVLTNVKSRGGWGEVQLSRQLEDLLTREQYDDNVAVRPGSAERVEFAVRLPGRVDGGPPVYLPIDSKLPQEDYERLLDAQENGDKAAMDDAGKKLERAILEQAKTIARKYIEPPHTTEFAIMYLPTEGLFAEIQRRPGLASKLANELHISVAGPSTLASLLNSLQMGFRTLAIEKRSSEVWNVLAAAKTEFQKYGQVWDKLGKQLATAQNTVAEAGRRTRAVEKKLSAVESTSASNPPDLLEGFLDEVEEIALPAVHGVTAELGSLDSLGVGRDEIDPDLVAPPREATDDTKTA